MIKKNFNKIFSISGFSYITEIHDGNFAAITMNNILKIYLGLKPFNCLNKTKIASKGTDIYNLKEILIPIDSEKIYIILYEKNILIYSFDNGYKKGIPIMKIINNIYIDILIQLNNKNCVFFDKGLKMKYIQYNKDNKNYFENKIYIPKETSLENNNKFVFSIMEFKNNHLITTSSSRHPIGENIIRVYEIKFNSDKSKLINYQNFIGYSCATFKDNICKLDYQKTICIAINFYIKKNIQINNNAIILLNYEYLEITTIIEIENHINTIFNFSNISTKEKYKNIFEYLLISQIKESNNVPKLKKNLKDNFRFLDFYVFEPKNEYEPLLMKEKRIMTNNPIDVTNSFLLNNKYLVIFQTAQINIYEIF